MGAQARRPVFRRMRRFSANQTSLGIDHLRQANEPETTRIELWRGSDWKPGETPPYSSKPNSLMGRQLQVAHVPVPKRLSVLRRTVTIP